MADQAFAPGTFYGSAAALTTGTTVLTEIEAVEWSGINREEVETTHLASTSGAKTFIPGDIIDYGTLTLTGKYSTQLNYGTLLTTTAKCDTLTITFGKKAVSCGTTLPATAATYPFSVVWLKFEPTWSTTEVMKGKFTFRVTGVPTPTAAQTP